MTTPVNPLAIIAQIETFDECEPSGIDEVLIELNAAVIAARALAKVNADLLAALETLMPHVPGHLADDVNGRPWIVQARAAITRATS